MDAVSFGIANAKLANIAKQMESFPSQFKVITQADYDALATKNDNTIYLIDASTIENPTTTVLTDAEYVALETKDANTIYVTKLE